MLQTQRTCLKSLSNYSFQRFLRRSGSTHSEYKVDVGGTKINIVEVGQGSKSVLLLPGALGSAWTDFKPQIEKLPALLSDYRIIAWDPPGYGKSIPPRRKFGLNFFENDAKFAVDLMKCLQLPKFSVLGWSDGGITALIMASRYGQNIQKLVIWGCNAYVTKEETKIMEDIRDVSKWSARMREPMENIYGVEEFAKLWSDWVDAYLEFYSKKNGDICIADVPKIRAPTFIVHGKKDPMVAVEHVPYLREKIKSNKFYEFPDGKHNIHLRFADEFNKKVADFLLERN